MTIGKGYDELYVWGNISRESVRVDMYLAVSNMQVVGSICFKVKATMGASVVSLIWSTLQGLAQMLNSLVLIII